MSETVDSDIDVRVATQRRELLRGHGSVLGVIAVGGGVGSIARYGIGLWLPTTAGHFPWGTYVIDVSGCFLIGALMVLITEVWSAHRLVRPFLGVGVLGGFTTFSTYTNEIRGLLSPGSVDVGLLYLFGTLLCALLAVVLGVWATRAFTGRRA
ncbi:MAG TPA: fluoride efflux transporter CrcB [Pseudonocardiaceae bacterium]|jgi:CrcB protein|nr:fluoride efflux transporter CrcB [Pseudonocardiaceae bacterium]